MTVARRRQGQRTATLINEALLRKWRLPPIDGALGKEGRGCVLVVGGSQQIPGAVILAATAALRAGAGKIQIATSRSVAPGVAVAVPEARVIGLRQDARGEVARHPERALARELAACNALLVGPGMMHAEGASDLAARCLRMADGPALVVDAAALSVLTKGQRVAGRPAGVVATPHAGEMAKLWGMSRSQVTADPEALAQHAAAELGVVMALKGAHTYVAAPDGQVFHNTAGNSGLGTAGSGDTLSGIIAGLCARGADAVQAAVWGVYLHARAGEVLARKVGPLGFLARELLAEIPAILARLGRST
jgi:ADP-dependent NAD(P)H-hydrate dehydratase